MLFANIDHSQKRWVTLDNMAGCLHTTDVTSILRRRKLHIIMVVVWCQACRVSSSGSTYCQDRHMCPDNEYCDSGYHYCMPCSLICRGPMPHEGECRTHCPGMYSTVTGGRVGSSRVVRVLWLRIYHHCIPCALRYRTPMYNQSHCPDMSHALFHGLVAGDMQNSDNNYYLLCQTLS